MSLLLAIIIGCLTGFVAAFFGIGGSSIDTPLLRTLLDLPPYEALATPLPLTVLTAAFGFLAYRREKLVNWRVASLSMAAGVPAMVAGSLLTIWIPGKYLMLFTAVVLFLVGVDFIARRVAATNRGGRSFPIGPNAFFRKLSSPGAEGDERSAFKRRESLGVSPSASDPGSVSAPMAARPPKLLVLPAAGVIGLLAGMLANGGGIFFVPAFVVLFRMKIKPAIATSLSVVGVMAVPGSLTHLALGHINLRVMAALAAGVAPMAWLGARFDIRTSSRAIMMLYGVLMAVFAVYFFISQLGDA